MQTRYKPIAIVAVLLGVLGVVGYLYPEPTEGAPMRLLFENAGGKVIFTHKAHAEAYKIPCQQCHHESEHPTEKPQPCVTCHPASYEEGFVQEHQGNVDTEFCGRCHHLEMGQSKFDHAAHEELASGCTDCHHDTDIEPEPGNCADCHQEQGDESMPGLRDAAHERCATCHEDMFDEKLAGCQNCHGMTKGGEIYPSCASCHFESKKLPLPAKMEAYHTGCMQCHKDRGVGPYTPQDCNKCHFR